MVAHEIPQIRRRLVLFGRHEQTVTAQKVDFFADVDVNIVFRAHGFLPPDRLPGLGAAVIFGNRPRSRERVIERGDFIMQHVRVDLVEVDPLLDDRLIVFVQRDAGHLIRARTLQSPGFDHQRVIAAIAVLAPCGITARADGVLGLNHLLSPPPPECRSRTAGKACEARLG
jgi:hypothetical protein